MAQQDSFIKLKKSDLLTEEEKLQVFEIWGSEYPRQSVYESFDEFTTYIDSMIHPTHFLIKDGDQNVLGWLATIDRDNERWLVILVRSGNQKAGIGSQLLNEMKSHETSISAWITPHNDYLRADGSVYKTPLPFYLKNDFILTDETFEKGDFAGTKITWTES